MNAMKLANKEAQTHQTTLCSGINAIMHARLANDDFVSPHTTKAICFGSSTRDRPHDLDLLFWNRMIILAEHILKILISV